VAEGEGMGAAQLEPALLPDIAFRDGDKRGDARLGGEHVVAGGVQLFAGNVIADGEHLPVLLDEETEVHLGGKAEGLVGAVPDGGGQRAEALDGRGQHRPQLLAENGCG
jgi:hypothetical protein